MSLKQWISSGFYGRIVSFDLCNTGTLSELTTEKLDDTSVLLVKFIFGVILRCVFSPLNVLKSLISVSLQSLLAAVSHLFCKGIERTCYFGSSLTYGIIVERTSQFALCFHIILPSHLLWKPRTYCLCILEREIEVLKK